MKKLFIIVILLMIILSGCSKVQFKGNWELENVHNGDIKEFTFIDNNRISAELEGLDEQPAEFQYKIVNGSNLHVLRSLRKDYKILYGLALYDKDDYKEHHIGYLCTIVKSKGNGSVLAVFDISKVDFDDPEVISHSVFDLEDLSSASFPFTEESNASHAIKYYIN